MTGTPPATSTHQIAVGGIDLYVRCDGTDGPWVVLIHALGADHTLWDAAAAHLATRYRVVRPDLRGHGRSGAPVGPYTMARMTDDVAEMMAALEIPQAHVIGLSLGGMVAMTMGVRYPERLLSLTLCDTSCRTPTSAHPMWYERIGQAEAHGMQGLVDSTLNRWFTPAYRAAHPEVVDAVRAAYLRTTPHGFVGACLAIQAFDLASALERIHCPTLVVVGEHDQGAPVSEATTIAESIRGAKLEVLPDAAHLSPLEQAGRFHAALDTFLGHAVCGTQCDVP